MQKIDSYNKDKKADLYRLMLWSLYAVAVIMKNIFATKRWRIGIIQAPAGYIFEPVTFIAQDVETETRGYSSAKTMIFWGFLLNIIVAACSQLAILLPNVSTIEIQNSFEIVLGNVPRILLASLIAYLIGGVLNVKVMYYLKMKGDNSLLYRAIVSTILGQFVDNIIFSNIAFLGIIPISQIIYMSITMTIIETVYEIVFYPVTKFLIFKIKEAERKDALI